ncbi:MAG: hypothetical protein N2654_05005, partial [Deltaproteobacteria bacterium]|nr:hypothetical protein [Deltaproteobacteria bacterium]
MSFGISYFELDAFWQDGKRLKNISNPDCLCLWGHEILRNRACNLFFQKGLGLGLSLNRSFTKVKSITEIEKRLRKILLTEITLTTDKIVAQNILISSFLEHGYK